MRSILKKLPIIVCTIFFSLMTSNLLHASEEMVEKILLNENYCVHLYEEDKIYLNHENIYPMENGLFLDLNGIELIPLKNLNADSKGCWISRSLGWEYPVPIKCPDCGGGSYDGKCTNPECPRNKK